MYVTNSKRHVRDQFKHTFKCKYLDDEIFLQYSEKKKTIYNLLNYQLKNVDLI